MTRKLKKVPLSLLKFFYVLLVFVPFCVVWFSYYEPITMTTLSKQVSVLVLTIYISVFYSLASRLDGFGFSIRKTGELIFGQLIAIAVTDALAVLMIWMLSIHFPNLFPGILCFCAQTLLIVLCSIAGKKIILATHPSQKAVVIYDVRHGMKEMIAAYGLEKRYDVQATCAVEDVFPAASTPDEERNALEGLLRSAEIVFICGVHTHERNIILKYCVNNGKTVFMIPNVGDMVMSGAERTHMFHLPFLSVVRYRPPVEFAVIKRAFDIAVSGLLLILLSPLFAVLALMIHSDGGPAFYRQVRLTKDGKPFHILKFRSMCVDAEKYSGAVLSAGENDPRITKVGRFIRACRMDEIPQLWNVFTGQMSIVGPRPERPELAKEFEKTIPEFSLRLQCKAGMTGYAQVYGKYNTEPYDKLLMDLMYIAHPSLLEDLTIILATVRILFSKESTEGVGEASTELKYEIRNREKQ